VNELAPAKINVCLFLGPQRPDGRHELVTIFQPITLHDELTLEPADRDEVICEGVEGPNLAADAVARFRAATGFDVPVRITIRKRIPVAGGMAGGSADAAAALVGLSALWKLELTRDELSGMAAELGSDVAFALYGGTAVGTGRGERIVPVLARHAQHWVIALHRGGLSTPEVFGELDRLRSGATAEPRPVEPVLAAIAGGDPRQLALNLGNDLQPAAVSMAPELRRTLRAGVDAGALAGLVSGSGPTCAFLCADRDSAVDVASELAGVGVCRTVRVAHGPVPGARVVDPAEPPPGPPPLRPLGHA